MHTDPHGPVADRPRMFGRSGLDPVLLPWEWAEHALVTARSYWIASTRPDRRPHTRPVWGLWEDGGFHFSTGSLAARNVRTNSDVTVHLDSGSEVVILEGTIAVTESLSRRSALVRRYNAKYAWHSDPERPEEWYEVRPQVAFGWIVDPTGRDGGAAFHGTATRWTF